MGNDGIEAEPLCLCIHEVVLISIEDLSLDAPVIVDVIRIEEVHAPPFALWGKTAEEKHLGVLGQEGTEWVILHFRGASSDVFYVQIRIFCVQVSHLSCIFVAKVSIFDEKSYLCHL